MMEWTTIRHHTCASLEYYEATVSHESELLFAIEFKRANTFSLISFVFFLSQFIKSFHQLYGDFFLVCGLAIFLENVLFDLIKKVNTLEPKCIIDYCVIDVPLEKNIDIEKEYKRNFKIRERCRTCVGRT